MTNSNLNPNTEKAFYCDGSVKRMREFKNDVLLLQVEYYENGLVKSKTEYKDGNRVKETIWSSNGDLYCVSHYNNGVESIEFC